MKQNLEEVEEEEEEAVETNKRIANSDAGWLSTESERPFQFCKKNIFTDSFIVSTKSTSVLKQSGLRTRVLFTVETFRQVLYKLFKSVVIFFAMLVDNLQAEINVVWEAVGNWVSIRSRCVC